ncbi:hypothetical protein, partial [Aeromonas allosaccharophila]|uniref:hypothetical protein n=1 Tax=Aeromonas allosaccharophila TaxID=656 RepID=UPI00195509E7
GSLSRYSKSTVRRHRRVSHFEVEFALFLLFEECDQGHIFGFCTQTVEKYILDISVPPGRTIFVHLGGFLAVYPATWLINESFVAMNDDYFCR